MEFSPQAPEEAFGSFFREGHDPPEIRAFAEELVRGVIAKRDALDEIIRGISLNWKLERMAVIDRNVLRLAAYELLHVPGIPRKVTINEAIEIAKHFGTDDSGSFVNGIVDRVAAMSGKP